MSTALRVGDKIKGDYGVEGEIKSISADGMSATVQLVAVNSWSVLVATPVSRLTRITAYSNRQMACATS